MPTLNYDLGGLPSLVAWPLGLGFLPYVVIMLGAYIRRLGHLEHLSMPAPITPFHDSGNISNFINSVTFLLTLLNWGNNR